MKLLTPKKKKQSKEDNLFEEDEEEEEDLCKSLLLHPQNSQRLSSNEQTLHWKRFMDACRWCPNKIMEWPYESSNPPFSFCVTFPHCNRATLGDKVDAMLCLQSNIPTTTNNNIYIASITVDTNIGKMTIPLRNNNNNNKLLSSKLQYIPFEMILPSDVNSIVLGEGNDYVVPKAKSNCSGMTMPGGGHPITDIDTSEDIVVQSYSNLLGGTPVCCLGIQIALQDSDNDDSSMVNIHIHNQLRGCLPLPECAKPVIKSPKRTIFEVDNYISSAWDRPSHFSMLAGQRVLRLIPPQPQLEITNITNQSTNQKAMEGTVNRIYVQLKAGLYESCQDIQMSVACTSSYIQQQDGIKMTTTTTTKEQESSSDSNNNNQQSTITILQRCPMLVSHDPQLLLSTTNELLLSETRQLPKGWKSKGLQGQGSLDDFQPVNNNKTPLQAGDVCYAFFDLFRPLPTSPSNAMHSPLDKCDPEENLDIFCRTEYTIQVSYKQSRPRKANNNPETTTTGDYVVSKYQGNVDWCKPMEVQSFIIPGKHQTFPSGNRHPTNTIHSTIGGGGSATTTGTIASGKLGIPIAATDATPVNDENYLGVRFTASPPSNSNDCLEMMLDKVVFNPNKDSMISAENKIHCHMKLISNSKSTEEPNVLFLPKKSSDFTHILKTNSKFGLTFFVQPQIDPKTKNNNEGEKQQNDDESIRNFTTNIGIIEAYWKPSEIFLPNEINLTSNNNNSDPFGRKHGPLSLGSHQPVKIFGPLCYIEKTPFEATLKSIPSAPKVAVPFEVVFDVTNKTTSHQQLQVNLNVSDDNNNNNSNISDGILVSGLTNGDIHFGPKETKSLVYILLASYAGRMQLPSLTVTSLRHNAWVIKTDRKNSPHVFIMP